MALDADLSAFHGFGFQEVADDCFRFEEDICVAARLGRCFRGGLSDLSSTTRGGAFSLFGFMALGGFEVEWGFIAERRV